MTSCQTKWMRTVAIIPKSLNLFFIPSVSSQMTLAADEVIFHKICATDDIETILDRFGPREVLHAGNLQSIVSISSVAQILWKTSPSAVKVIYAQEKTTVWIFIIFVYKPI